VSPRATLATTLRVLTQLRRDPRTIGLIVLVPTLLVTLLRYLFDAQPQVFDRVGGTMLGIFPFITMFVVTSVTMLRERVTGTLERLMTMPVAKLDILLGYALAFALVAIIQSTVVSLVAFGLLDLHVAGSHLAVVALAVGNATLGMALGLFASAFARTEFQAIQFMPVVVLPQLLLCGLFRPREEMALVLRWVSDVMPMSYAVDAIQQVAAGAQMSGDYTRDVVVVAGCVVAALGLAAATLRRQTA
jgi:ABC-2 type transport system permease protein